MSADAGQPKWFFARRLIADKNSMRTGKDLILATRAFARENVFLSWWAVISTVLALVLTVGLALAPLHWAGRLAASMLSGLLIVRLFVIYHDHLHHSILARSRVAKWLFKAWGMIVLAPSTNWKHSHNQHHAHNSKLRDESPGAFPVMTAEHYLRSSGWTRLKYRLSRHPVTLALGYVTVFIGGMCIAPILSEPRKHLDSGIAPLLHIALIGTVVLTLGWMAAVFAIVLPFSISCALGSYLFYAQHNFPDVELMAGEDGWTHEVAALRSSSYFKMGPVMRYFTANIGFHHIHHLNAGIPFYRLPDAFRSIPELTHPKTTSFNPVEIVRCLRLDVWDSKMQRLVPLSAMRS